MTSNFHIAPNSSSSVRIWLNLHFKCSESTQATKSLRGTGAHTAQLNEWQPLFPGANNNKENRRMTAKSGFSIAGVMRSWLGH
jgi:hypothetical protein